MADFWLMFTCISHFYMVFGHRRDDTKGLSRPPLIPLLTLVSVIAYFIGGILCPTLSFICTVLAVVFASMLRQLTCTMPTDAALAILV